MAIQIYGDIDRRADGKIRSFKPSQAEHMAIENLREEIDSRQRGIKMGLIPASEVHLTNEAIRKGKERLGEIENAVKPLTDQERDWAQKYRKQVGAEIGEKLFTHTEMDMGFADPHEEVDRMTKKTIKIDPEQAKESGVTLIDGKGSRNDAAKIFQHLSYRLGESPDIERLRKTGKRGSNVRGHKGEVE